MSSTGFYDLLLSSLRDLDDQIYNPAPNTDWLVKNSRIRGRRIRFDGRFFQEQILNDMHENLCCIKISQIGLTEIQIQKALMFCVRNPNRVLIFSLPEVEMRDRIVQTRVYPLLTSVPVYMRANDGRIRSYGNIALNSSFLMFLPADEKSATSQNADIIFNDEVDLSDQQMLALFNSRMQASDLKISQRFSTPTFTGFGIDSDYRMSDQHVFMYKCPRCNHWQDPKFNRDYVHVPNLPDHIQDLVEEMTQAVIDDNILDFSKAYYHCSKCRLPLDLNTKELRSWVATYPNRKHHRGYKVSLFCVNNLDPAYVFKQLLKYKKENFIRGFYNTVLGEAYNGGDAKITLDEITKLCGVAQDIPYNPAYVYFIGVDMGQVCHITVLAADFENKPFTVLHEQCPSANIENRVSELVTEYSILFGLVDRHPYEPTSKAIMYQTNGIVVPCEYSGTARFREVLNPEDKSISHVAVNRTMQLDLVATAIKKGKIGLNGYNQNEALLAEHLQDMVRVETPEKMATWQKNTGQDHFFHSLGYALQAMEQYNNGYEPTDHTTASIFLIHPVKSNYSQPKLIGGSSHGSSTFKLR